MKKLYVLTAAVLLGLCSPAFALINSLTVTSGTLSKSTGQVTLSGTITCTAGDEVFIEAEALQVQSSQKFAQAYGYIDSLFICSGGTQSWTIVLDDGSYGSQGFKVGKVGASANAYDNFDGDHAAITKTVQLRYVP